MFTLNSNLIYYFLFKFLPRTSVNTTKRLSDLRNIMSNLNGGGLQAYIVPSIDAHQVFNWITSVIMAIIRLLLLMCIAFFVLNGCSFYFLQLMARNVTWLTSNGPRACGFPLSRKFYVPIGCTLGWLYVRK